MAADVVGYSRLMGADEEATAQTFKSYRKAIGDLIAEFDGRVFGGAGDSVIAEFASPVEAVRCAVEFQREIEKRNAGLQEARRMRFRIGVNLGDVMIEGDDLLGDGVNVAARLEALAEPGGILISGGVHTQVEGKLDLGFDNLSERPVKNIAKPVQVFRVRSGETHEPSAPQQEIRFCRAPDGVQLAYASVGAGPPLVKAANWLNHLEYDWDSPVWRHLLHALANQHRLVRFDARGNGLSD
ncbi:MAG: adenylate/guanylate cyclase domain-containing protein, partial [Pseudomonadota bacterium]